MRTHEEKTAIYYSLIREHYNRTDPINVDMLIGMISMGDTMAPRTLRGNPPIQTEISPSGRTAIRWVEDRQIICLLGIISGDGRLCRQDYKWALEQRKQFEDKVSEGKAIMASVNKNTSPFIDGLIKAMATLTPQIELKRHSFGEQRLGNDVWENIILSNANRNLGRMH